MNSQLCISQRKVNHTRQGKLFRLSWESNSRLMSSGGHGFSMSRAASHFLTRANSQLEILVFTSALSLQSLIIFGFPIWLKREVWPSFGVSLIQFLKDYWAELREQDWESLITNLENYMYIPRSFFLANQHLNSFCCRVGFLIMLATTATATVYLLFRHCL